MKFLILGATGMAGHVVSIYLSERGHDVIGLSRQPALFLDQNIVKDVEGNAHLDHVIASVAPDVVVNCVGLLNQDCDKNADQAVYLNSYLPHQLEAITRGSATRIFHLSTDCVFAGNTGPYTEDCFPDGKTMYDRSKALGELINEKDLTLRQSIIGPDMRSGGIGLFNWFMSQHGSVKGYTEALWTGLTTLELAKAIEQCALDGSTGLVNMVPSSNISKYELLCLFNKYFRDNSVCIIPSKELKLDKTLLRTNLTSLFQPASYEMQIKDLSVWVKNHAALYPAYEQEG